ncbi:hypothetical protein ACG83_34895 [Frankia sp. R43]|uniref:hypothetical protein n=1 Tax=Frankia sp. R43 TaxID=269536 RepID=UPI0006CA3955|nr:hypothetical protein [Frankia sp. R43]KPM51327.1 hypothetical protein ACG83_34895 [Frankia sp. R43]
MAGANEHAAAAHGRARFFIVARDAEADPRTAEHFNNLAAAYAEVARLLTMPIPYDLAPAVLMPDAA